MPKRDPASMSGREVFVQVTWNAIANVLWYGGATLIIVLVGKFIWWLGVGLFGIFALIMVASTFQTLVVTVLGIISIPLGIYERLKGRSVDFSEQAWLWAGNMMQLIELMILGGYVFWLFRQFFRAS